LAQECVVRHAAGKGEIAHHGWPSHEKYENWKKDPKISDTVRAHFCHLLTLLWMNCHSYS